MYRLCLIFLWVSFSAAGQSVVPDGFNSPTLSRLKAKDLSLLWMGPIPIIDREDTTTLGWLERPEPLGYSGENFERLRIHITYVQRAPGDSLCYELEGFTRTNRTVAFFEGTLQLDSLTFYSTQNEVSPDFWGSIGSGWSLWGHYSLKEDSQRPGTGILEGVHRMDIAADFSGNIYYDTMYLVADSFQNNQWKGTRRRYDTGVLQPCNWGDFRIPDSDELDGGCGVFSPKDKYLPNGWQVYRNAWFDGDQSAITEETYHWWREAY